MRDLFMWFTRMENTKPFVLVLFFVTFVLILLYVFASKKRSKRLESYKNIPLDDEDLDAQHRKELNHEHRKD
jgi:cbb3-type cytochrome oxidase subunit 3